MPPALFAGIYVSDYVAATEWYIRIVVCPERAGHSVVTVFVGDLDRCVAGISERGIEPAKQETYDNGVRKVLYRDLDGNEIGFGGAPQ